MMLMNSKPWEQRNLPLPYKSHTKDVGDDQVRSTSHVEEYHSRVSEKCATE